VKLSIYCDLWIIISEDTVYLFSSIKIIDQIFIFSLLLLHRKYTFVLQFIRRTLWSSFKESQFHFPTLSYGLGKEASIKRLLRIRYCRLKAPTQQKVQVFHNTKRQPFQTFSCLTYNFKRFCVFSKRNLLDDRNLQNVRFVWYQFLSLNGQFSLFQFKLLFPNRQTPPHLKTTKQPVVLILYFPTHALSKAVFSCSKLSWLSPLFRAHTLCNCINQIAK